jgi:ABC-type multidrug transport system fused ATPase/permease subunit
MRSWHLVRRSLTLLGSRDRLLLGIAAIGQVAISFLDLAAVLLLGLVAAAAASQGGIGAVSPGMFGLLDPGAIPLVVLAAFAGCALISKSVASLWLTRRIYRFLANRQAAVAGRLAEQLLTQSILKVQERSSQVTAFALTAGVNAATVGTLGPAMVIGSEISLVLLLVIGLMVVDPLVALFTLVFFGLLAALLQFALGHWAADLGEKLRLADVESIESLQHSMRAFREVGVSGRRALFIDRFVQARWSSAKIQADYFILSQGGKYVFEIGLVAGGGLLILIVGQTRSMASAVAVLTVFLITTSRLVPSLLRLQTAFTTIRNSQGIADETFRLADDLRHTGQMTCPLRELSLEVRHFHSAFDSHYAGFEGKVELNQIALHYAGASMDALSEISLTVESGESIALVGPTGSGKSTLADIVLGVIDPTGGTVLVSGLSPRDSVSLWPGAMSYVPQDVAVLTGTVRSNVALGFAAADTDDALVWEALERAHLGAVLKDTRAGLDTIVGENGVQLSGGQRQRLGIARALYSRPRLLVLDEATSALDAETEHLIAETIHEISGNVTLFVIAHRLATVRSSNRVVYLDKGRIRATGTFDEVRNCVPEFDRQATLLGL